MPRKNIFSIIFISIKNFHYTEQLFLRRHFIISMDYYFFTDTFFLGEDNCLLVQRVFSLKK